MFTYVVIKKLKRGRELIRTLMSLFTILVLVFGQGCGFSRLKQDLKELETVSTISGTIISESPKKKPIFIGLFSIDKELLRYNIKYKSGHYEFFVLPGTYFIAAFEDADYDFSAWHPSGRTPLSIRDEKSLQYKNLASDFLTQRMARMGIRPSFLFEIKALPSGTHPANPGKKY